MKQLLAFVLLLAASCPAFSQVEIRIVNKTGFFLMNVEIEGQKIGSLPQDAAASVTVDAMSAGPYLKADYRNKTFAFPQRREICGNGMQNHRKTSGSYAYAIILLKDRFGEDYLSLASNL